MSRIEGDSGRGNGGRRLNIYTFICSSFVVIKYLCMDYSLILDEMPNWSRLRDYKHSPYQTTIYLYQPYDHLKVEM
jgi:hypothetical protein